MILLSIFRKKSEKFILFITILASPFFIQNASAQNQADTTKTLLASIEKNAEHRYFIRKSNVVFPEILKGNEEEMLPYIENFCNKKRDYVNKMYKKGKSILPKAATILKKYDLPGELNVLLALESEYDGNAVSPCGAVGYWQIMDDLASDYDMNYIARLNRSERKKLIKKYGKDGEKQYLMTVKSRDDRKNFVKATHAAARYLRDCNRRMDDNWLLVVASYNSGLGNVKKAIRKSGKINPTFWDIKNYLPSETRAYVKNFIALTVIFHNYEMFASDKLTFEDEKIIVPEELEKNMAEIQTEYSDRK